MFLTLLIATLGVGAGLAVACWHRILGWSESALIPWFDRYFPDCTPMVRQALAWADRVSAPVRRAWKKLRGHLKAMTVKIGLNSNNEWVKTITTQVSAMLGEDEVELPPVRTEEVIGPEELPEEFRTARMLKGTKDFFVDILRLRDKEIDEDEDGMAVPAT